jgi:acetyl esterase/lipase
LAVPGRSILALTLLLGTATPVFAGPGVPSKYAGATFDVSPVLDVAYYDGPDADHVKHKLDLFLPKDQKDFPVVLFVHGGAWRHGDKSFLGVYRTFGMFLARHGIGAVVTNYRLSPAVKHPEHIKDVARAFSWTYKNIARYGGRPDEIFLCGHSAGGHLVALLATDDAYLKAVGLGVDAIRGVIPISGVYQIAESSRLFDTMFGVDARVRRDASPIAHVRADAPPFLIVCADHDISLCGPDCSKRFCQALREHHADAEFLEVKERNHLTVLLDVLSDNDPLARAILDFIADHTAK